MDMTIIKAVRFCQIGDDEFIYFTDGKHPPYWLCLTVRKMRKHVDMSIPVIHATPFYLGYAPEEYDWLFTISTKDYEDLLARKDWF